MANERDFSHFRDIPLDEEHKIRRRRAIIELQKQVKRLTKGLD